MSQQAQIPPSYLTKLKGDKIKSGVAYPNWREILISALGGVLIIALLKYTDAAGLKAFVVPFGATAVLLFAAPGAPFSQPRNFIGGHLISATIGVAVATVFQTTNTDGAAVPLSAWWTLALANGLAILLMVATKTIHPPAGATALLPVVSTTMLPWSWVITPVLVGCLFFLVVAVLYNNSWPKRKYPGFWI